MTPDTALRLGRVFATTPEFWLNLQASFDLTTEGMSKHAELEAIRPYKPNSVAA